MQIHRNQFFTFNQQQKDNTKKITKISDLSRVNFRDALENAQRAHSPAQRGRGELQFDEIS
jgi:hypothetical protein